MTGAIGGGGGGGIGGMGGVGGVGGVGGAGMVGSVGMPGGASLFTLPPASGVSLDLSSTQVSLSTQGIGQLNIEHNSSACLEDLAAMVLLALLLERKNDG